MGKLITYVSLGVHKNSIEHLILPRHVGNDERDSLNLDRKKVAKRFLI